MLVIFMMKQKYQEKKELIIIIKSVGAQTCLGTNIVGSINFN